MDDRYAAGLFDGEGYIRVTRWEKPNSTHIRYALFGGIGMTYLPVIEELRATYGGSINQNRHDLRNQKHRIMFLWQIASQVAASFLRRIEPYAIVKKDEISLSIKFQDHIDSTPYKPIGRRSERREGHEDIYAFREDIYRQLTALKKRSFPPLLRSGPMDQ